MAVANDVNAAPPESDLTPDDLVRRARELRPRLVELQADTEERTYYSPETHQAFEAAGLYRIYVPRRYGGHEFDALTFVQVLIELARGCASTAWCFGLAAAHALQVASYFDERTQAEVFGDGREFRAASVAAPDVDARREEGGWRLDGTVGYCSGIPYSTHFLGQAVPERTPPEGIEGNLLLFLAPRDQWTMLHDWGDQLGLRGSGSHSIVFEGGRVPDHYVLERTNMMDVDVSGGTPGLRLHGNPLYAGRNLGLFSMTLAAVTVGAGYNALDEYERLARTRKTSLPPPVPRHTDPDYQRWLGTANVQLATAEAALLRCAQMHRELCERAGSGGDPFGFEEDQHLAAIGREVMVQVWETAERNIFRSAGARVMVRGARMERLYRDLSMIVSHRNTGFRDPVHRLLGQMRLADH
ncbi:acyl-CoA dehydrogenase family protein [Actinoallomurus purpureus]|uniref:acyl-CoA dehydrogenase family protein n=1 Tax=Actinoallomurus purpureus TaxID=478114 RepID=UPI002092F599|nr:acyl-CoA dehydrogenase family protein [Actinoallomurus purpureus]MCO6010878.1 acyl-CoA dehydrogenase family protein [Actinoallomurus purpureus]